MVEELYSALQVRVEGLRTVMVCPTCHDRCTKMGPTKAATQIGTYDLTKEHAPYLP